MEKTELNNKMFEILNKYHKTGGETNEIKSLIEQGEDRIEILALFDCHLYFTFKIETNEINQKGA